MSDEHVNALAAIANEHHAAFSGLAKRGLAHALAAGEALNRAKAEFVPSPGYSWAEWMRQHLTFDKVSANWYMRIDYFRDELPDDVVTMKGAMRFLQENGHRVLRTLDREDLKTIYAMFDAGSGQTEIAKALGTTKQNVHHHIVNRDRQRKTPGRPRRPVPIDDLMIERAAGWLVNRFADAGYFVRVTDQVRHDAEELLRVVLAPEPVPALDASREAV